MGRRVSGVWSNYVLISTHWFTAFSKDQKNDCQNEAGDVNFMVLEVPAAPVNQSTGMVASHAQVSAP